MPNLRTHLSEQPRQLLAWLLVCVLALAGFGTAAYVTDQAEEGGVITLGSVGVELESTATGEVTIYAGGSEAVCATVASTGENPVWVRVAATLPEGLGFELNTSAWEARDGYFWLLAPLDAGEVSEPLFESVTLADGVEADQTLVLNLDAYAVQSQNNGSTVWQAAGWPEDVDGSAAQSSASGQAAAEGEGA